MARTPVRPLAPNPADGRSSHASPGRWPRPRTRTAPCSRGISCSCGSRGVRSRPGRVSAVGAMKTRMGGGPGCRRRTRRRVPWPASRPGSFRAGPWGTEQYHAPRRGYGSIAKHLGLPPLAGAGRLRGKQGGSICRSPAPVPFLPRIPPRSGVPAVEPHDPFADVVVRDP